MTISGVTQCTNEGKMAAKNIGVYVIPYILSLPLKSWNSIDVSIDVMKRLYQITSVRQGWYIV